MCKQGAFSRWVRLADVAGGKQVVLALAGRRIDAVDTEVPVFPAANAEVIRQRITHLLQEQQVHVLVCSAACGADLLALEAAERLGVRRRIVLPFEPGRFRETSVVDRPGNWGAMYDRIIPTIKAAQDVLELGLEANEQAYVQANHTILSEILRLARELSEPAGVALVWDGRVKEPADYTDQLRRAGRRHGLDVFEVSTL